MTRKALITGCAGFIGSHLTQRLLREGLHVIGVDGFLDNYDVALKLRNLSLIGNHPLFIFHSSMLSERRWEQWLEEVDLVFHLAALPGVRTSWGKAFSDYVIHNLIATQSLLDACTQIKRSPKIIVSSSSSVYGTMKEGLTGEQSPKHPISPYGVTKAAMEDICRVYVETFHLPVVILRYFTVYGPRQRPDMAFQQFFRQIHRGESVTLYGDGQQSRDFTYVSDATEANLLAAKYGEPGDVFNIGGEREIKLLEVLELMGELTAHTPKLVHAPPVPGDSRRTCADISLARSKLGYQPQVKLEEGLRLQWEEIRAQLKA
ncbi:GDP-mannose 4,6-dehydratase [Brevibacillus ruminantium]|uniref:GDP-mannose 4,6-dehydratase n=1 Tax=Brevibacillus ruminantium TaxID=2950604 RepID=A0ABY4W962_9BACL|nr:NAD-dependent epimerase/dehydratase family protein [Brevibacillus ruminantium]USG63459.1 GDP-mannose 4,6-dehydratase [Brevibacillus ruminantium]